MYVRLLRVTADKLSMRKRGMMHHISGAVGAIGTRFVSNRWALRATSDAHGHPSTMFIMTSSTAELSPSAGRIAIEAEAMAIETLRNTQDDALWLFMVTTETSRCSVWRCACFCCDFML